VSSDSVNGEPTEALKENLFYRLLNGRRAMKTLFVIAGSYPEFTEFKRWLSASTFYKPIYANHPEKVAGCRGEAYTYIGTWYKRDNLNQLQLTMVANEMNFIAAAAIVPANCVYWEGKE
jgi:hypothetical protein